MAGWRKHKAKAKRVIHATFEVPAVYVTHAAGTPILLTVREHTKVARVENEFTWPNTPGFYGSDPALVFLQSDLPTGFAATGAFVFVSPSEIYRIDTSEPPKDGYVRAHVTDATADDVADITVQIDGTWFPEVWSEVWP